SHARQATMDASAATTATTSDVPVKEPSEEAQKATPKAAAKEHRKERRKEAHLPPLHRAGDIIAPTAPQTVAEARLEEHALADLAIKVAYTTNRFTIDWVSKRLHLSTACAAEVIEQLCREALVEETMMSSTEKAYYRITSRGREHAGRSMEVCAYIGPAPVRLEAY